MLDENEHSRKEDGRSLHRLLHKAEQQDATVVVDSAAFFSELPPEQAAPPRRPQQNIPPQHCARGKWGVPAPETREDLADRTGNFKRSGAGAAVAHPDAAGAVSGGAGGAAGAAVAAGQALSGVQNCRHSVPGVLGGAVRRHGGGLRVGAAGPRRAGQYDQRFFEQRRG